MISTVHLAIVIAEAYDAVCELYDGVFKVGSLDRPHVQ